jgi:DNA-binding GntR family transcriptional regulator
VQDHFAVRHGSADGSGAAKVPLTQPLPQMLTKWARQHAIYRMPVPNGVQLQPRELLRDDVFRRLRDAIVDGTFAPGEQLRDAELAGWLGVSRTPIREALLRLAQAGLVVSEPGKSTTVTSLDVRATRDAQSVVAAMHGLAVREAVPHLTEDDLARMRAANTRFAAALRSGDVDAALAADDELHAIPVAAAANRAVKTVLDQFTPVLRRVERLRFSSLTGRGSVALHEKLIGLCTAGDQDAAAEVSWETWQTLEPLVEVATRSES